MESYKSCCSVIYKGDVGSAGEWCQIKLHTSCDVPAPLNQLKNTRCRCCPIDLRSRCRGKYIKCLNFFLTFFEKTKNTGYIN